MLKLRVKLVFRSQSQGLSVIIDRTDINLEQRMPWLQLAREKAGQAFWVMSMASKAFCEDLKASNWLQVESHHVLGMSRTM